MKRGEIYLVDLGPDVGREIGGVRPVVIVSNDAVNAIPLLVGVVPVVNLSDPIAVLGVLVTAAESGFPTDISVLATQPRSLDPSRFPEHPSGAVPPVLMEKINFALGVFLGLK